MRTQYFVEVRQQMCELQLEVIGSAHLYFHFVCFPVHAELRSLPKALSAARLRTSKGFLPSVYEIVFTEVLLACESLEANGACVGLDSEVCGVDMSAQVKLRHKGLGAVGIVAEEVWLDRHILLIF